MNANDLSFDQIGDKIKTIIFDLGGVYFTSGTHLTLVKLNEKYQINDWASLSHFFRSEPDSEGSLLRLGLISMDDFEYKFFSKFKINENNQQQLRRIWFSNYIPYYEMPQITELLNQKYRLIAFSGNIKERIDFLDRRYDFLKFFHKKLFSFDYNLAKNNPKFYEILLEHIKCKPSEAILIDDSSEVIKIAQKFDINTILFSFTEQMLKELSNFSINLKIESINNP